MRFNGQFGPIIKGDDLKLHHQDDRIEIHKSAKEGGGSQAVSDQVPLSDHKWIFG